MFDIVRAGKPLKHLGHELWNIVCDNLLWYSPSSEYVTQSIHSCLCCCACHYGCFWPLGEGIYHHQEGLPVKWSSEVYVQSSPGPLWILPWVYRGQLRVLLHQLTSCTALTCTLNVPVDVRPPHMCTSKSLHLHHPHVTSMELIKYLLSVLMWNDSSRPPHQASLFDG